MKTFVSLFIMAGLAVQAFAWERPFILSGKVWQERLQVQYSPALAEKRLFQLANKINMGRKAAVVLGGFGGAVSVGTGIYYLSQKRETTSTGFDFGPLFNHWIGISSLAMGGMFLTYAAFSLALPNLAEKDYKRIQGISDPAEREKASEIALAELAKSARKNRMKMGMISVGLGSVSALLSAVGIPKNISFYGYLAAAGFGLEALFFYLEKSREEKAYLNYSEKSPSKAMPSLTVGLAPQGGICLGFSLSFL